MEGQNSTKYYTEQISTLTSKIEYLIKSETIIHHPDGDCKLEDIQKDVIAWQNNCGDNTFGFTSKTVQALIDKIIELTIINK